jgi:uncharacterized protein (TIGR00251 family)
MQEWKHFLMKCSNSPKYSLKNRSIHLIKKVSENKNLFQIKLIPKSSANKIEQINDDSFKVYVTAVPESGKANKAMINLLSKHFKIPKTSIEIIKGHTSRNKIIQMDINS